MTPDFFIDNVRNAEMIPSSKQNVDEIEKTFASMNAGTTCFAISSNSLINERNLDFRDALDATVGYGFGTVLLFPHSNVAYYEGEDRNAIYILRVK